MPAEEPRLAAASRSGRGSAKPAARRREVKVKGKRVKTIDVHAHCLIPAASKLLGEDAFKHHTGGIVMERSEEHTSELQSLAYLVCRLLLEKKNRHSVVPARGRAER